MAFYADLKVLLRCFLMFSDVFHCSSPVSMAFRLPRKRERGLKPAFARPRWSSWRCSGRATLTSCSGGSSRPRCPDPAAVSCSKALETSLLGRHGHVHELILVGLQSGGALLVHPVQPGGTLLESKKSDRRIAWSWPIKAVEG